MLSGVGAIPFSALVKAEPAQMCSYHLGKVAVPNINGQTSRTTASNYRRHRQENVLRSAKAAQLVTIYALLTGLPEAHIEGLLTQACTGKI